MMYRHRDVHRKVCRHRLASLVIEVSEQLRRREDRVFVILSLVKD